MPRSIWNGTIRLGLISVAIKVHSATEDRGVHFHQVHEKDGARIKQKRICSKEGKEVPYKALAKGYEVAEDEYVMLSQDEINAAAGDTAHVIELEEFVSAGEIDPVYFNRTYYVGAGENGEDAYRLLHDAMGKTGRAGIGRWVFHNREYLVAVRAHDNVLALHTMQFADELVAVDDLELAAPSRAPNKREIEMAGALVESLHDDFKPKAYKDTYRERVLELIERKAKGEKIETPALEEPEETPDLLAALEASLKASGGGSGKRRSSSSGAKRSSSKGGSSGAKSASKRTKAGS